MSNASESCWQEYRQAADTALAQSQFEETERLYLAALEEAEKFGPRDQRVVTSLWDLIRLYDTIKHTRRRLGIRVQLGGQVQATSLAEPVQGHGDKLLHADKDTYWRLHRQQQKAYRWVLTIQERTVGPEYLN
ncbi:MAG: hypothetical protein M3Q65_09380 [Chloroflexota bacterium]|nr:hypothetical protein [Chloroflexota bacterium]